ncbi:MAG: threonylcarbamoyl-AMP synthase [Candidatus Portnoybacteria bacterium]|nr:threonylcarbamoyl-AMP synthase [Candidatus Portnoybacteria bacterium]
MKIIKIDYKNPDPGAIKKVAEAINKGKVAIVPGDAVYTIVADAFNSQAIKKVYKMKRREKDKTFNLGLYRLEDIAKYGKFSPLIYKIAKKFPKEPFTFAVPRNKEIVPDFLNPDYQTLGFRVPFNKVTSTLSKFHRTPVIGTSANISELKDTYSIKELMEYFRGVFGYEIKPDIVLDAGKLPVRRPSTVIEIVNNKVKIIREGEIKTSLLEKEIIKLANNFKKKLDK